MADRRIRPAKRSEARALTSVHRVAAHTGFAHIFPPEAPVPAFEDDLARWECWLGPDAAKGRRCYVAEVREDIVGVVLAGPDPEASTTGHLSRLYVHPDHWGTGIGAHLYASAKADLRARFDEATLWVLEGNGRARSWYERLGWRLTERRMPTYAPAGIHDVQYRIDLVRQGDEASTHPGDSSSGRH